MAFGIDQKQIDEALAELEEMESEEERLYFNDRMEGINEAHLVAYVDQCVKEDNVANRDRHQLDRMLWEAHENKMREMQQKDVWQSKIVLNDPFTTCYQAKTIVRKSVADRPDYFSVEAWDDKDEFQVCKASFWEDALRYWMKVGNFQTLYPDMTEMGFATGVSLGAKSIWVEDAQGREHHRFRRIKPWHLKWDPDRQPRDAQSGLYCIHEEWVDYHKLLEGEANGVYQNVQNVGREEAPDYSATHQEYLERDGRIHHRHDYRKAILVREFYGDILDHNGELLLSKVRMVVANRTIIKPPTPSPFLKLRWPIHQFCPLPSIERFHGYSLIEGVLKMWKFRNNLLSITADNLNFILNQAYEVDISKMQNPGDTEIYPGALKYKKAGAQGNIYEAIGKTGNLQELQALWNITGTQFQNGSFVTELVHGQVGQRRDITKGEVQIKTEQAMGVFDSIGKDTEDGGVQHLQLVHEILTLMWDPTDIPRYDQIARRHGPFLDYISRLSPEERQEALALEADIHIRGVSRQLEKATMLERYRDARENVDHPILGRYIKAEELMRRYFDTLEIPEVFQSEQEIMENQNQSGGGLPIPGATPDLALVPPTNPEAQGAIG